MIILFDLDGTLIDSTDAILECMHHSFDIYNYSRPSDEEIKALIGYPLDEMYASLGVETEKVWDFVATYKECYRQISTQKTTLLPNAAKAVQLASEFASIGIVTTKTGKYSRVLMEHFHLMHHFDVLVGREDVTKPKPDKEPIVKALKSFNTQDKDIWMIGDTKLDLLSAKDAEVNSIGVLSGYDDASTLLKYSNIVLDDAYEAIKHLKSIKSTQSNQ